MLNAGYPMLNRRHFLKHLAGFSLMALPGIEFVESLRAAAPRLQKEHKSIIILWMSGGPPTIDMWDLKPGAPTAGEFKTIKTSVPGIEICEHMPLLAKQMQHVSIIRSLKTSEGDHSRGRTLMHTGYNPSPIMTYPSLGSLTSFLLTPKTLPLPGFISIGRPAEGPGFLGMNYAPFTIQDASRPPANIRAPSVVGDDMGRVHRRQRLFYDVEDSFIREKRGEAAKSHSDIYSKAFSLVASPLGKVFDINTEPKSVRDAYGINGFGNSCLLARKLAEQGVTCVEVDLGGWDLHANTQMTLKTRLLPVLDKAMAALVKDLVTRGLWKNTVLAWMGEFGRTPRINQNAGRDHWPQSWSVVVGGGAIKGGQVFGATDDMGIGIKDNPVSVGDVFATLFKGLGLDPEFQIRDNLGRPMPIAPNKPKKSHPIKELLA